MLKELLNYFIDDGEKEDCTLCHLVAHFVTTDGEKHSYHGFNYINLNSIIGGNATEYLMDRIVHNKYIKDDEAVHYPMENVLSVKFECDGVIEHLKLNKYQVFFDTDDLKGLTLNYHVV